MTDVDTTACDMLEDLASDLAEGGIELHFAELKDPVREKVDRFGLSHVLPAERFHPTVNDAVRDYRHETGEDFTPA